MKIPKMPRRARRFLAVLTVAVMAIGVAWWVNANISVTISSSSSNHAATSAALNSASATAFNTTAYSCTLTSTTTATCPPVQLTIGGSGTESGNYTLSLTFTASPAGAQITAICVANSADSCTDTSTSSSTSQIVFATGSSQTVSFFVKPVSAGSGTASVTLSG